MTDKERMINGEYYSSKDLELIKDRKSAEDKVSIYNSTTSSDSDFRFAVLKDLFKSVGEIIEINSPLYVEYGYNTSFGTNVSVSHNLTIMDCAPVEIGNNVIIGPNVNLITNISPINTRERIFGTAYAKKIVIRDNVCIGAGVTICPGVTIGSNSVVNPGTVVDKNVPLNSVVGGNPFRIIREMTNDEIF